MKKITVMSVFGTRPEATKMCPLVKALEADERFESVVCVTAQHRELLDSVLEFFGVVPDFDLNIMKPRQTLADITSTVILRLCEVLRQRRPDILLVHGDTTTSFAAALAAFYEQVPVGHVEAGLRTYDKYSPFPEEMNRTLTTRIAHCHFAPTVESVANLKREGVTENIYVTGNTGLDSFRYTVSKDYKFKDSTLASLDFSQGRYILMTAHRRENIGQGLENICSAVKRLVDEFEDIRVIYPVHPNPAVRETVFGKLGDHDRIYLLDPIDVTDMHNLITKAYMFLTDSGGIQEEAPTFGVPVLVLRTETERPEAVAAGTVKIVGIEEEGVYTEAVRLLTDPVAHRKMSSAKNPYGDGKASERIADAIWEVFNKN